jgi:hypothetical protein
VSEIAEMPLSKGKEYKHIAALAGNTNYRQIVYLWSSATKRVLTSLLGHTLFLAPQGCPVHKFRQRW